MEKTIRMPKVLLDKWLVALRSGQFQQGRARLESCGAYCCLGVLQAVADGDVERHEDGTAGLYPKNGWMAAHGIEHLRGVGWDVYLPSLRTCASNANDDGLSFAEIADAIEACAEGV